MGIAYDPDGEAVRTSGGTITREGVTNETVESADGVRDFRHDPARVGRSGPRGNPLLDTQVARGGPGGETTDGPACVHCDLPEGVTPLRRFVYDNRGNPWHDGCAADVQWEQERDRDASHDV